MNVAPYDMVKLKFKDLYIKYGVVGYSVRDKDGILLQSGNFDKDQVININGTDFFEQKGESVDLIHLICSEVKPEYPLWSGWLGWRMEG